MDTKVYLAALEKVVSERFSHNMYCIGSYQECAVCMQPVQYGWIVFNGERGNRYNEVECDTVLRACLEFIRKLTHRVEDISAMEYELLCHIAKLEQHTQNGTSST